MTPKEMIAAHRENYPDCPGTRQGCTHWGNFRYVATFADFPMAIGNLEAFDEQTARKLAHYMLGRDVGQEIITLEIVKV